MSNRVVLDPVTRIEGHLRIEMTTTDGKIDEAWSETTQFKGSMPLNCVVSDQASSILPSVVVISMRR